MTNKTRGRRENKTIGAKTIVIKENKTISATIKEHSIISIFTIVGTIIGAIILSVFISPQIVPSEPVLFLDRYSGTLEGTCPSYFYKNESKDMEVRLENRGDVSALATLCISSKEFVVKSKDTDFVHQFCWPESRITQKQTNIIYKYLATTQIDSSIFDFVENATLHFDVSCKQKIWFYKRTCENRKLTCTYKKDDFVFRRTNYN